MIIIIFTMSMHILPHAHLANESTLLTFLFDTYIINLMIFMSL